MERRKFLIGLACLALPIKVGAKVKDGPIIIKDGPKIIDGLVRQCMLLDGQHRLSALGIIEAEDRQHPIEISLPSEEEVLELLRRKQEAIEQALKDPTTLDFQKSYCAKLKWDKKKNGWVFDVPSTKESLKVNFDPTKITKQEFRKISEFIFKKESTLPLVLANPDDFPSARLISNATGQKLKWNKLTQYWDNDGWSD